MRIIDGIGVGVPPGHEHLLDELVSDAACATCGGSGLQPGEPQPDRYGAFTPCDACEGTGTAPR